MKAEVIANSPGKSLRAEDYLHDGRLDIYLEGQKQRIRHHIHRVRVALDSLESVLDSDTPANFTFPFDPLIRAVERWDTVLYIAEMKTAEKLTTEQMKRFYDHVAADLHVPVEFIDPARRAPQHTKKEKEDA